MTNAPARPVALSLLLSLRPGAVDEKPDRLCRAAVRPARRRPGVPRSRGRSRWPWPRSSFSAGSRASSISSTTSPIGTADRLHPLKRHRPIASGAVSSGRRASARRVGAHVAALAGAWMVRPAFAHRGGLLPCAAGVLLGAAQAHRHHRRADDCDGLRAARGRRRGGHLGAGQTTGC